MRRAVARLDPAVRARESRQRAVARGKKEEEGEGEKDAQGEESIEEKKDERGEGTVNEEKGSEPKVEGD
jgi:hypothetical protein